MQTYQCPKCGAQNPMGQAYCLGCGQMLPYTCYNCQAPINATMPCCPKCNAVFNWPAQQPPPAQTPPAAPRQNHQQAPPAQQKPPNQPMSNAVKVALVLLVIFIAILGSCAVCLSGDSEPTAPGTPPSTAPPPVTPPVSQPSVITYQIGQKVDIGDGAYLKVESSQRQQSIVCVTVLIDNSAGSKDMSVSSMLSFKLKDSNGNQAEFDIFAECQHYPPDGTVLAGDKLRGSLGYNVSSLTGSLALYYQHDLLASPIKIELE